VASVAQNIRGGLQKSEKYTGGDKAAWWMKPSESSPVVGGLADRLRSPGAKTGEVNRIEELAQDRANHIEGFNKGLEGTDKAYRGSIKTSGQTYLDTIKGNAGTYKEKLGGLMREAEGQSKSVENTYSNTIQPQLKSMLDDAQREASGAMTLQQAGDPNNAVHQATRNMFNTEASNVQNQGLAASGVLGSLGAQNASMAFGANGPMTVGQQQALYAASQGQAGQAFANAQRKMNDLRQQGILQGYVESDRQYQRGQGAKDRHRQAVGDVSGAEADYLQRTKGLREERGRGAADVMGIDTGLANAERDYKMDVAGADKQNAYNKANRDTAVVNARISAQQALQNAMAGGRNAVMQQNAQYAGAAGTVGGAVAGGYFGGPAGAAAGSAAGGQAASAAAGGGQSATMPAQSQGNAGAYQFNPNAGANQSYAQNASYDPNAGYNLTVNYPQGGYQSPYSASSNPSRGPGGRPQGRPDSPRRVSGGSR